MKKELKELIFNFQHLGVENAKTGATLIGRAPHIGHSAWLNTIYPTLNFDDVLMLENKLQTEIPAVFKDFLMNFSNGLHILNTVFCIDGLRRNYIREIENSWLPFDLEIPNVYERPSNAKDSYFFIGGYDWDGSELYIDKETNMIHYCDRDDATSLYQWESLYEMLISEITRIYALYDGNGIKLNPRIPTTPIYRMMR